MDKLQKLRKERKALLDEAYTLLENGELEAAEQKEAEADAKTVEIETEEKRLEKIKSLQTKREGFRQPVTTFGLPDADEPDPEPEDPEEAIRKSVNHLRYARVNLEELSIDELCRFKAITELYGGDYRQINNEQNVAFRHYLINGGIVSRDEEAPIRKMYWPIRATVDMLKSGFGVKEIKTTMVEGISVLGGVAVPPERSDMIIQRAAGLTAVRRSGAMVIETASKMIEWAKITQGNSRYPSALRGAYGSETQAPTEDNFDTGMIQIPVHLYTYKVSFSTSLLEDATNMVEIFTQTAAETLTLDEDNDFLIGDGANKPRGITPSQANSQNLNEVVSGNATDLTMDGFRKLRRGVDSQYRTSGRFVIIGNNQAGEDLELLTDGQGRYFFPDGLMAGEEALRGTTWYESEALPDPAAGTYSLIAGDMSGYAIVERLGLAIQRYNDSNTGINKVEFHVRRRIGGDVIEPWKLCVQKVST